MPRSAIMVTKSLRLSLKLVHQLTQRMMICPSKCRPLNSTSTETNRCILPSSPITACLHQNRVKKLDNGCFEASSTKCSCHVWGKRTAISVLGNIVSHATKCSSRGHDHTLSLDRIPQQHPVTWSCRRQTRPCRLYPIGERGQP